MQSRAPLKLKPLDLAQCGSGSVGTSCWWGTRGGQLFVAVVGIKSGPADNLEAKTLDVVSAAGANGSTPPTHPDNLEVKQVPKPTVKQTADRPTNGTGTMQLGVLSVLTIQKALHKSNTKQRRSAEPKPDRNLLNKKRKFCSKTRETELILPSNKFLKKAKREP